MLNDYKVKQIIEFVRDKEYNSLAELTNLLDPSQTIESVKEFLKME